MAATDAARGSVREQPHVAAAQHHVLGGHRGAQQLGAFEHGGAPRLLTKRIQAALAEHVLERLILVWQVRELERDDPALVHQRGAEPRAESEKQHAAALVAAERLHRRVVEDADRHAEGGGPVEADPAVAEVPGLFHHRAAQRPGWECRCVTTSYFQSAVLALHAGDYLLRREPVARVELARFRAARMHQLDVGAADVDDENSHIGSNDD